MMQPAKPIGQIPGIALLYGWLGLIPFLAPPLVGWLYPQAGGFATDLLVTYGALILSFLGGARWGLEIREPTPNVWTISLSMLPTLAALGLVATPALHHSGRLIGLAVALASQWVWDFSSTDIPPWYPRLRAILTSGAVIGLLFGAIILSVS